METPELLVVLTASIIAAAIGGAVAVRLRQSAVVGYIVAGVAIGALAARRVDPARALRIGE